MSVCSWDAINLWKIFEFMFRIETSLRDNTIVFERQIKYFDEKYVFETYFM